MNYEKDLTIDQDALDVEWLEQPRLMMRYARIEAEAEKQYANARASLELIKAEVDKTVRMNPEKFDIAKITEGAVSAAILMTDEYKEALAAVTEAS